MDLDPIRIAWLAIPHGRRPDWDAAARQARALRLDHMEWRAGGVLGFYPWEGWWEDTGEDPGALHAFVVIRNAQEYVLEQASHVRGMIECEPGDWGDFFHTEFEEHRVWLAVDYGDVIFERFESVKSVCMADVATAAGFTDQPNYGPHTRTFQSPYGDRATRFGVTLAHAVEEEHKTAGPLAYPSWMDHYHEWMYWLARVAQGGEAGGKALLRFAGTGLSLSSKLLGPRWTRGGEWLDSAARDIAILFDRRNPSRVWTSHREVAAELADGYEEQFKLAFEALTKREAVGVDLAAQMRVPILAAILALTDLHGWGVGDLLESAPEPILAPDWARSREVDNEHGRAWSEEDGFSVLVDGGFDAVAARNAAREIRSEYPQLEKDIAVVDDPPYHVDIAQEVICGMRVLVAYHHSPYSPDEDPDVAEPIARLGSHGILTAGGAVWWSAPDVPLVSQFAGIMIAMYPDDHDPPHFHARHKHGAAKINIDPVDPTDSTLGQHELRLVLGWAELHQEELLANWRRTRSREKPWTIPPLR